ncbi:MAG: hypothetical protein WCP64_04300 [Actinomycetes bacterium]
MTNDDLRAELERLKKDNVVGEMTAQIYLDQVDAYVPEKVEPAVATKVVKSTWSKPRLALLGVTLLVAGVLVGTLITTK